MRAIFAQTGYLAIVSSLPQGAQVISPNWSADGKKTTNAKLTVSHNGVQIHKDVDLPKATTAAPGAEGADPGPIYIQDHGNPIRFRNIWVVEKK